jgi:hypothetical protein
MELLIIVGLHHEKWLPLKSYIFLKYLLPHTISDPTQVLLVPHKLKSMNEGVVDCSSITFLPTSINICRDLREREQSHRCYTITQLSYMHFSCPRSMLHIPPVWPVFM